MKTGENWRPKGNDKNPTWRIVSIDSVNEVVGMSGPGPCRAYQTVSWLELELSWERA